ncbi:uncharacterized protein LOC133515656 [Cydia pomonella]|uniref:uncharacterized protein LOC133515656 n=1 Tax=Cydia pomonella TaxID=82600 RepID=UPI002ADE34E8|nr:uncharacterized protein LOC133515656 [Cydia pomonella]
MKCVFISFIIEIIFIIQSGQHFIPPLQHCVLAEICNHTRSAVCGEDKKNFERRIFHDECDMFELNCDGEREFALVNISVCYQLTNNGLPVNIYSSRRRYNKKILQKMKKEMLEKQATFTLKRFRLKNQTTPLPETTVTTSSTTTTTVAATTTAAATTTTAVTTTTAATTPMKSISTVILKKETVWKNGKLFMKIVKGLKHEYPQITNESSGYISN